MGEAERLLLWGGYEDAERKKAFFLPDRMMPLSELGDVHSVPEIYFGDPICALELRGSGYRELTNRDWLGAILNLGIERDACGDIRTDGGSIAYMVCDRSVGELIMQALERVGRDTVKIREISFYELETLLPKREFEALSDTVSTPRLDAVVGSLCRMAREKAKITVQSGAVQCGGRTVEKPDSVVSDGDIISVRGHGKFRVLSVSEQNKKGRYRLLAEKYK
jgi:RNA-binding protein YlmH